MTASFVVVSCMLSFFQSGRDIWTDLSAKPSLPGLSPWRISVEKYYKQKFILDLQQEKTQNHFLWMFNWKKLCKIKLLLNTNGKPFQLDTLIYLEAQKLGFIWVHMQTGKWEAVQYTKCTGIQSDITAKQTKKPTLVTTAIVTLPKRRWWVNIPNLNYVYSLMLNSWNVSLPS